jgi:hypothetical protein
MKLLSVYFFGLTATRKTVIESCFCITAFGGIVVQDRQCKEACHNILSLYSQMKKAPLNWGKGKGNGSFC